MLAAQSPHQNRSKLVAKVLGGVGLLVFALIILGICVQPPSAPRAQAAPAAATPVAAQPDAGDAYAKARDIATAPGVCDDIATAYRAIAEIRDLGDSEETAIELTVTGAREGNVDPAYIRAAARGVANAVYAEPDTTPEQFASRAKTNCLAGANR
jgi:hypothetical protein